MLETRRPPLRLPLALGVISSLSFPLAVNAKELVKAPTARRAPVTDTYHGTSVVEDYRWLEKSDDPEVKAWTTAQNAAARAYLDRAPNAAAIKKRLTEIMKSRPVELGGLVRRKNLTFALRIDPSKQQPQVVVLTSFDDPKAARLVVDPNAIDPSGKTSMDFFVPSVDGTKIAVSLSKSGTEDGTVHVFDVATGKELGDVIPRVNGGTAGGSLAWLGDGSGFFYTRYPRGTERAPEDMPFFQQVWLHKLGTPTDADTYAIGKDFPRIAECELETSEDGKYTLLRVANGDGGEYAFHLFDGAKWTKIADLADQVIQGELGQDGALYLLSRKDAPKGKILRLPFATPTLASAKVVVPESDATIQHFLPTTSRLYVADLLGGPSQIRTFALDGKSLGLVPILPVSAVSQLLHVEGDAILFRNVSYVEPAAWYRYDGTGAPKKTGLVRTAVTDWSDTEVVREMARSLDGTMVPVNIIKKKDLKLDGSNPTLLYGYGGYNISLTPGFVEDSRVWLEQGGIYAIANLRGGGEYGEAWHKAGYLTRKQNVFDDMASVAVHLIERGYTRPEHLAVEGGSNGGLLMGAMITQHPELFRAVISHVGIYDMLRVEGTPNGAFNVTEFGTVKDAEQFRALYAYSPYHRVVDGVAYPSVLITTGLNDPRVDPWHSKKMVARLQAATSSKKPVLLRAGEFGHGIGSSLDERIALRADAMSFLVSELGVKYRPVSGLRPAK